MWRLLNRTHIGLMIRAGVDDRDMLAASGVRIQLVIVFAFGAGLAGLAGVVGGTFRTLAPGEDIHFLLTSLVMVMRTTTEVNARMGRWIGERLNRMDGPVRFFLPEGGVPMLDAPGQAFHDPEADAAPFETLEQTVRRTGTRRLVRLPSHINDPAFSDALAAAFEALAGGRAPRTRGSRR